MKLRACLLEFGLVTIVVGFAESQTANAPSPAEIQQTREEIQQVENLLPKLPDRGAALFLIAHDYAVVGESKKALSTLKECISLGEGFNPEGDSVFASLKNDAEYKKIVEQAYGQYPAVHRARQAFTIEEKELIPEGLAVNSTNHVLYMGSLHRKKILKITRDGHVSDLFREGQYDIRSICGIKVDPKDGHLWANTCPDNGQGAELLEFDDQGKLLARFNWTASGPHLFNDLVLRGENEIYLTDSLSNYALRFDGKTHAFTPLKLSRSLYYPNGIALSDDSNLLYVADAFGVLLYDLRTAQSREVHIDSPNTISGIDGLYWYRGSLIGIQNSLGLSRIALFHLSADGARATSTTILEYRTDFVELPTTGAIDGADFYFMTNTYVDQWKNERIADPAKLQKLRIAVLSID